MHLKVKHTVYSKQYEKNLFLTYFFREFASTIPKPFKARYDPYTQSIELLDSKAQIMKSMRSVNREISVLTQAMTILDL